MNWKNATSPNKNSISRAILYKFLFDEWKKNYSVTAVGLQLPLFCNKEESSIAVQH